MDKMFNINDIVYVVDSFNSEMIISCNEGLDNIKLTEDKEYHIKDIKMVDNILHLVLEEFPNSSFKVSRFISEIDYIYIASEKYNM